MSTIYVKSRLQEINFVTELKLSQAHIREFNVYISKKASDSHNLILMEYFK